MNMSAAIKKTTFGAPSRRTQQTQSVRNQRRNVRQNLQERENEHSEGK